MRGMRFAKDVRGQLQNMMTSDGAGVLHSSNMGMRSSFDSGSSTRQPVHKDKKRRRGTDDHPWEGMQMGMLV